MRRTLAETGFDPDLLILELTETALLQDVEVSAARLAKLKECGLRIAIDDFGIGYSSLAYLQQFPIDILKIDQSFIGKVIESGDSASIVHTMVELAKILGAKVTAEGIETIEQLTWVRSERVDVAQGYLFARPLAIGAMLELLAREEVSGGGAVWKLPTSFYPVGDELVVG